MDRLVVMNELQVALTFTRTRNKSAPAGEEEELGPSRSAPVKLED